MKNFPIVKSRRLRSTPYTDRIESHGVSSYTVYNHMLLPASFKSLESDYEHLKKFVQVWDVAAERQVEISGKDSAKLVQLMTCRDLSKSKVGKCYYAPLIDDEGLLVNDPIINKLADDKWWLSIADSDVIFFAKGLAAGNKFDVEIHEPNVNILAVQGPLADDLMSKLFGDEIRKLKFFNFDYYIFNLVPGFLWFFIKVGLLLFVFLWVRATLPRFRYDQLMRLGWKIFLPLSLFWVFVTASVLVFFDLLPNSYG